MEKVEASMPWSRTSPRWRKGVPDEEAHLKPPSKRGFEHSAQGDVPIALYLAWGWTLQESVVAARLIADKSRQQGVYLAFDKYPTLGAGFRAVFEQV